MPQREARLGQDGLAEARRRIGNMLTRRLSTKGSHSLLSRHEILGVVGEEFHELVHTVKEGNKEDVADELIDLAVACIVGMASLRWVDW